MSDNPDLNPIAQPNVTPENRGYETKVDASDASTRNIEITLVRIDEAIINYLSTVIKPIITDNDRVVPVPVVYASPERWKTIKRDGFMRDQKNDKLQTPLITIRRSNIIKNPLTNPSNKYLYTVHGEPWNPRVSYDRFAVQNNIRPSKQAYNIIIPDYIDITYQIIMWTEYQEQMNSLIEQINVENQEFWGLRNEFKFRVDIGDYSSEDELPATEERIIRNTIDMRVAAYLVPEKMVKNYKISSTNSKTYSKKKIIQIVETDETGKS